jgi:hypothetical protein
VIARSRVRLARWGEPVSISTAALLAVLVARPRLGEAATHVARVVGPRIGSAVPRLEPYSTFVVVALCALGGMAATVALWKAARARPPFSWLVPLVLLAAAETVAFHRGRWLVPVIPIAVLALTPLFYAGAVRPVPVARYEALAGLVCVACEAACVGLGIWFPLSRSVSIHVLLGLMAVPAVAAFLGCACLVRGDLRARAVCAGLPTLTLPFVGLSRNPTLVPTLVATTASLAAFLLLTRFAAVTRRVVGWARHGAIGLAVPAVTLWLLLPWRFRDMASADSNGHESQHLGWLNSLSFGKWMMADAGFTYGPLREYALAGLTMLQGSLTLEHFRIAYVAVNVAGFACLFAAMRMVCARQIVPLLAGAALLVTHSTIAYFLIYYVNFGAFGWADAARAGLATVALVVAIPPDVAALRGDGRALRRRACLGGWLAGVALLYSHDFGVPASLATWMGMASIALVPRDAATVSVRLRAALRYVAAYVAGAAAAIVPFLAPYAAYGRLGKLAAGYRWAIAVSRGATPFSWEGGGFPLSEGTFGSLAALTANAHDARLGTKIVDYAFGPAVVVAGLGHVASALARRQFRPRTAVILALTAFQAMVLYYAFVIPDASHVVNSTTPGLVLLVALAAGGRGLGARVGRFHMPIGVCAAALAPAFWLLDGSTPMALRERLERLAAREERPSFGAPYHYEFPRAGDEHVDDNLLRTARAIVRHSAPADPVYCTTWMLGGGAEAFLSDRRNPTSFDKPDEIASEALQRQALSELQADPPKLIVGTFFQYLSEDGRRFIEQGWHRTEDLRVRERNR